MAYVKNADFTAVFVDFEEDSIDMVSLAKVGAANWLTDFFSLASQWAAPWQGF